MGGPGASTRGREEALGVAKIASSHSTNRTWGARPFPCQLLFFELRGGPFCQEPIVILCVKRHAAVGGTVVQSKPEQFRARAAECEQRAAASRDPEVKRQYQELARQWHELAEQADRRSW